MRIERGQHAVDGCFDQLVLFRRGDILGADALEHIAEDRQLAVGLAAGSFSRAAIGLNRSQRRRTHEGANGHVGHLTYHCLPFLETHHLSTRDVDRQLFRLF